MDKATLQSIKSGTFPATPEGDIYREMQKQVGIITNDFTAPQNISTQKVDMTEICKQNGITPKQFEDYFGSIQRSEADAVQHLAAQCASTAVAPTAPGTDKAKRLRLAKAKIAIADADRARLKMKAA